MRRSEYFGVILIGMLVVAAISVAAGSGRKPPKERQATVSSRRVSKNETIDILREFPELIPGFLASKKDDGEYLARIFGFSEVTAAPLVRVFPSAHFYLGRDFNLPSHPYLMAIAGGRRYLMPGYFNLLLRDNGQKATNKNIIALAEAFIVAAMCDREGLSANVTFLGASKTKHVISGGDYDASLKVRIGQQIEEWSFSINRRDQLGTVYRRGPKGYIDSYDPAEAKALPTQGRLETRGISGTQYLVALAGPRIQARSATE